MDPTLATILALFGALLGVLGLATTIYFAARASHLAYKSYETSELARLKAAEAAALGQQNAHTMDVIRVEIDGQLKRFLELTASSAHAAGEKSGIDIGIAHQIAMQALTDQRISDVVGLRPSDPTTMAAALKAQTAEIIDALKPTEPAGEVTVPLAPPVNEADTRSEAP